MFVKLIWVSLSNVKAGVTFVAPSLKVTVTVALPMAFSVIVPAAVTPLATDTLAVLPVYSAILAVNVWLPAGILTNAATPEPFVVAACKAPFTVTLTVAPLSPAFPSVTVITALPLLLPEVNTISTLLVFPPDTVMGLLVMV